MYLEAYVDCEQIYIPDYGAQKMKQNQLAKKISDQKIRYGKDLFVVTGKNYANIHLFIPEWYGEDRSNYGTNYKLFWRGHRCFGTC